MHNRRHVTACLHTTLADHATSNETIEQATSTQSSTQGNEQQCTHPKEYMHV